MKVHSGENLINGVTVEVVRKRCRRINLRVDSEGGVHLTIPKWWATLREGAAFLESKWSWVLKTRAKALLQPRVSRAPVTEAEVETLRILLAELNDKWASYVGEPNVTWKIRRVKSVWGCCHWRSRYITYNAELARVPRELVEYVVVHEFTHFAVHGHGPKFYALMDKRLPGWPSLRTRLNKREWETPMSAAPPAPRFVPHTLVQATLPGF